MESIDLIDKKIALELGQDALQRSDKIAKKLNISSATVRRRIRNLTQSGVVRIIGVVDPQIFGLPLASIIALNITPDKINFAINEIAKRPEIRWVSTTTGRYSIIALGRFNSNDHLSDFISRNLALLEGLKECETFICLDMKKGHYVPFSFHRLFPDQQEI